MPPKKHGKTYDLVLFGATGYTGVYTAEHITTGLPTDLKWALAGRSQTKLDKLAADIKLLNPDRVQPAIEVCNVDDAAALEQLAKKAYVLISTVGPYGTYGEPLFKACAEAGTHYIDVTGEAPFVAKMIRKYEAAAKASGAIMIPQCGIESAPADLAVWEVARINRTQLQAKTRDVTASVRIKALPSGGTLLTVLTIFDNFSLREIRSSLLPYALSPVPRPGGNRGGRVPLLSYLTGAINHRILGRLTTSMSGSTDAAQVERTWGLLSSSPGHSAESYGPNFSFAEYANTRTWFQGFQMHLVLVVGSFLLTALPPLRWLAMRFVFKPGTGPTREEASRNVVEYRAVGTPDIEGESKPSKQAFSHAIFRGGMYHLTGILAAEAAITMIQDDLKLDGGIYTPSFLGQNYIERLNRGGYKVESKVIDA